MPLLHAMWAREFCGARRWMCGSELRQGRGEDVEVPCECEGLGLGLRERWVHVGNASTLTRPGWGQALIQGDTPGFLLLLCTLSSLRGISDCTWCTRPCSEYGGTGTRYPWRLESWKFPVWIAGCICERIMAIGAFAGIGFYLEITEFLCQDFCLRPLFIEHLRCACHCWNKQGGGSRRNWSQWRGDKRVKMWHLEDHPSGVVCAHRGVGAAWGRWEGTASAVRA